MKKQIERMKERKDKRKKKKVPESEGKAALLNFLALQRRKKENAGKKSEKISGKLKKHRKNSVSRVSFSVEMPLSKTLKPLHC